MGIKQINAGLGLGTEPGTGSDQAVLVQHYFRDVERRKAVSTLSLRVQAASDLSDGLIGT